MSDKFHVDAGSPIDLLLEWKDDQHLVDKPPDLFHAAFAPRPDLRADVIDNRNAGVLDALGQSKVEVGEVDKNCGHRPVGFNAVREPVKNTVQIAKRADHFERSDDSCLADVADQLNASFTHSLAAQTKDLTVWEPVRKTASHI